MIVLGVDPGTAITGFGIIDIYRFDLLPTPSLSYITTATILSDNYSNVNSIAWCQECDNLAVTGYIVDSHSSRTNFVWLYHFDEATETLSFVQEYTSFVPINISWCDNCRYLAVGGTNQNHGVIQLYKSEFSSPAPANLHAQKIYHRFPTQVDIINKLCWDAVSGAVAYNVYADANLSILLATITNPPLCYSQHQICRGKSSTYYVTAIDAQGHQSEPAMVTV